MLLFLEQMEKPYRNAADIRKTWIKCYEDLKKETPDFKIEDFIREDYYDEGEYIFDTDSGVCYRANDYFHKVMNQE